MHAISRLSNGITDCMYTVYITGINLCLSIMGDGFHGIKVFNTWKTGNTYIDMYLQFADVIVYLCKP